MPPRHHRSSPLRPPSNGRRLALRAGACERLSSPPLACVAPLSVGLAPAAVLPLLWGALLLLLAAGGLAALARWRGAERDRLHALLQALPDPVVLVRVEREGFRCVYANPALAQLLGQPIVGKRWRTMQAASQIAGCAEVAPFLDAALPFLQQVVQTRQPVVARLRVPLPGGERLLWCRAQPARAGGEPVRWMVVLLHDRTAEVADRQWLMRSERLAGLSEVVRGVAHELNNPLAVIKSTAQLLRQQAEAPPSAEDLQAILDAAERAARVVRNLQYFAQEAAAEHQAVHLNEVVERVARGREGALRTLGIELHTRLAPGLTPTRGDADRLEQVLLGLVDNAEQAICRAGRARGRIELHTALAGEWLRLTVSDDGPGIPPEHLPGLFDPFFTTHRAGDSTGLGLAVAHGIITEHHGRITVSSEPGRGARFVIELPAALGEW